MKSLVLVTVLASAADPRESGRSGMIAKRVSALRGLLSALLALVKTHASDGRVGRLSPPEVALSRDIVGTTSPVDVLVVVGGLTSDSGGGTVGAIRC